MVPIYNVTLQNLLSDSKTFLCYDREAYLMAGFFLTKSVSYPAFPSNLLYTIPDC